METDVAPYRRDQSFETMLAILKLLQSLVSTLHSEGSPTQVAAGFALGAALGLTPILNLHNGVVFLLLALLNVSFGAGMLAWALFVPVGFLLDPLFHALGRRLLLETPALLPFWTKWDNTPVLALTGFDNTVVLGSVVTWLALWIPLFIAVRVLVIHYRVRYAPVVEQSRFVRAVTASKAYNVYRWFRP